MLGCNARRKRFLAAKLYMVILVIVLAPVVVEGAIFTGDVEIPRNVRLDKALTIELLKNIGENGHAFLESDVYGDISLPQQAVIAAIHDGIYQDYKLFHLKRILVKYATATVGAICQASAATSALLKWLELAKDLIDSPQNIDRLWGELNKSGWKIGIGTLVNTPGVEGEIQYVVLYNRATRELRARFWNASPLRVWNTSGSGWLPFLEGCCWVGAFHLEVTGSVKASRFFGFFGDWVLSEEVVAPHKFLLLPMEELETEDEAEYYDRDNDGLSDFEEVELGCSPLYADTDGDGLLDGEDPNPLVPAQDLAIEVDLRWEPERLVYSSGDTQEKWVHVTVTGSGPTVRTYVKVTNPSEEIRWAYYPNNESTLPNFDPATPLAFSKTKRPLYDGTWQVENSDWHWDTYTFTDTGIEGEWSWEFSYEDVNNPGVPIASDVERYQFVALSRPGTGLEWLRNSQAENGSWSGSTGITALVLLSFFNAGMLPDDTVDTDGDGTPDLQEGMAYLAGHFDTTTGYFYGDGDRYCYDTSLCMLAFIAADRGSGTTHYQNIITQAKDYLLSVQYDDNTADPDYGGWGYPRAGWADLSNTQWVVMALDAAYDYLGLTKPSPATSGTWTNKLLVFLGHCQRNDGGFDYKEGYFDTSFGSMSTAGLWSLLLAGLHQPEARITQVQNWISDNYTLDKNPGRGSTALYYYYVSLAKALTMAGWSTITDSGGSRHDWYAELENKLASLQHQDGYWVNADTGAWEGNKDLCTAYALLALETQQLPHGEQLSWVLTLHSPGTLHVYSPDGDHVGPSNVGAGVDEDIPGSSYTVKPTGEQVITISGLEAGAYRVQLLGTSSGAYTLDSVVKESDRVVSSKSFTGTLLPGQARVTRAVFTAMEGAVTQFMGDLQATPAGLTATSGNEIVNLTWTPFTETDFVLAGYNVYRSTTPGGEYVKITVSPVDVASYRDAGLPNDITYYYVVTAVSSAGSETPYSPEVQATPSLGMSGQNAKIICGPNPVSAAGVTFFYALPVGTTEAQIMIFDIPGRLLFKDWLDPTEERYPASGTWDLISLNGTPLGNGAYTFVLIADGKAVAQGKMVIQR